MEPSRPPRSALDQVYRAGPLLVSLVALGLSAEALRRSTPVPAVDATPSSESRPSPAEDREASPRRQALRPLAASAEVARPVPSPSALPASSHPGPTPERLPLLSALRRPGATGTGAKPTSSALTATAARFHVRTEVLATVADPSGELPSGVEARLTQAQQAGSDLARRAGLDDAKAAAVSSILVDYVVRTLREDDPAHPGDPDRLAPIKQDALAALRSVSGSVDAASASAVLDTL